MDKHTICAVYMNYFVNMYETKHVIAQSQNGISLFCRVYWFSAGGAIFPLGSKSGERRFASRELLITGEWG